jgi:hypothetical protein
MSEEGGGIVEGMPALSLLGRLFRLGLELLCRKF